MVPGRRAEKRALPAVVPEFHGQAANDLIRSLLLGAKPAFVGRIGYTEMRATMRWWNRRQHVLPVRAWNHTFGNLGEFWWDDEIRTAIRELSGFFPTTNAELDRFAERLVDDLAYLDVLGSWLPEEVYFSECMPNVRSVRLEDLEPYYHENPWTGALAGRRVLVVHPFAESIRAQYAKRAKLFTDPLVLPEFELKTMKSVQSLGGRADGFRTWFEALDSMCERIAATEFDVAIVGAGAYGLPLGAFVKRLGRSAVHLGGATQVLFGIQGKRWDERPFFQQIYNEHWVRPSTSETPASSGAVEGGCYW